VQINPLACGPVGDLKSTLEYLETETGLCLISLLGNIFIDEKVALSYQTLAATLPPELMENKGVKFFI